MFDVLLLAGVVATPPPSLPLSVNEAVDLALRVAPTVKGARASRDQADLAVLRANLDRFSLSVDAQIQEIWARTNIGGDASNAFEGLLGLSNITARLEVPVFSGFRVEATVARAEHLAKAAEHAIEIERLATILATTRAYWSVRRLSLLADVARSGIQRLERAEAATRARVRAGLAPPLDANRALSRRRLQQVRLINAQGQRRQFEGQLAVLLGAKKKVILTDEPVFDQQVPSIDTLLDEAIRRRPELMEVSSRIEAQEEAIRIALSEYYPQLGVFGLFQVGNNPSLAGAGNRAVLSNANPFGSMVGDVQLGVNLSLNVFDTLNTWTSVKSERIEAERLAQEYMTIRQQVETNVRESHAQLSRLVELVISLKDALAIAQDNVQITETRYQDGEALVLELLEAELELADIERQRTEALVQLMTARAEVSAAVGRGAAQDQRSEE